MTEKKEKKARPKAASGGKKEKKASPRAIPKKNILFRVFLIFFASAWMFVLGVLVGRGTAPVHFDIQNLQKELAALKEAVLQKEIKRYKINSPDTSDKPDLGFHEALKAPAEGAGSKKRLSDRPKADRRDKAKKRLTKTKPAAASTAIKPGVPSGPLRSGKQEKPGRGLTIQVASSRDLGFADSLVDRLKAKKYPAYRVTAKIPGKGTWHRVRIGRFDNRAEASHFLSRLKKENLKGIIVKESP
jgi:cell division septation protein DedD